MGQISKISLLSFSVNIFFMCNSFSFILAMNLVKKNYRIKYYKNNHEENK